MEGDSLSGCRRRGPWVRRAGSVAADFFGEWAGIRSRWTTIRASFVGARTSGRYLVPSPVYSHYMRSDLVVALMSGSYHSHVNHVAPGGVLVYNSDAVKDAAAPAVGLQMSTLASGYSQPALRLGVGAVVVLLTAVGLSRDEVAAFVGLKYERDAESNVAYGLAVFDGIAGTLHGRFPLAPGDAPATMLAGNEAIGLGMYAGGLDIYFAYPMTPSSRFCTSSRQRQRSWELRWCTRERNRRHEYGDRSRVCRRQSGCWQQRGWTRAHGRRDVSGRNVGDARALHPFVAARPLDRRADLHRSGRSLLRTEPGTWGVSAHRCLTGHGQRSV